MVISSSNMEDSSSSTLCQLMQSFQSKLDLVNDSLLLRSSQNDPDCQQMLTRVQHQLRQLEITLTLLRTEIKVQQQGLVKLKVMTSNVEQFMQRVSHAQSNIPEHIPKHIDVVASGPNPQPSQREDYHSSSETKAKISDSVVKKRCPSVSNKSAAPALDFLTVEEFNTVPKYMKGRITYELINNTIGEFNKALSFKHKILATHRTKQNIRIKNQIVAYKEQECKASDGYFFIVDSDLLDNTRIKLDNAGRSSMTILRHCGRIKEVRRGQINRYCVCSTDNF